MFSFGLAFGVVASAHGEQYICKVELSTGFAYDKGKDQWEVAVFQPGRTYIISRPAAEWWEIKEIGSTFPHAKCPGFNEFGFLELCDGLFDFKFNRGTGRFMTIYPYGYVFAKTTDEEEERIQTGNTPSMSIGKCSPF